MEIIPLLCKLPYYQIKMAQNSKTFIAGLILIIFFGFPLVSNAASSSLQINQNAGDYVPSPSGGGGSPPDVTPPQISDVVVTIKFNSVSITWKTLLENSTSKLEWGLSQDYSDGSISSPKQLRTHAQQVDLLQESSLYYFLITAIDDAGNQSFYRGQFITGNKEDLISPLNVSNFVATPSQTNIVLSWQNPNDNDFIFTRIVRSTIFFPTDPLNGFVVYEGSENGFVDTLVTPGVLYYYTAFTRDLTGNYSSGGVTSAMIIWYSEVGAPVVDLEFIYDTNIPNTLLSIDDFTFSYQNGAIGLPSNNINLPQNEILFVTIDKSKLPESSKFIMWNSEYGSYFFAYNKITGNYELYLPRSNLFGSSKSTISVFNNAQQIIQDIPVTVNYINSGLEGDTGETYAALTWNIVLISLILILIGIYSGRFIILKLRKRTT